MLHGSPQAPVYLGCLHPVVCPWAGELAARTSQSDVMARELDHLRRQAVELQTETERTSSQLAKVANECDVTRAAAQRISGQLEDTGNGRILAQVCCPTLPLPDQCL